MNKLVDGVVNSLINNDLEYFCFSYHTLSLEIKNIIELHAKIMKSDIELRFFKFKDHYYKNFRYKKITKNLINHFFNPGGYLKKIEESKYYLQNPKFQEFFNKKADCYGIKMIMNPEPWPHEKLPRIRGRASYILIYDKTNKLYMMVSVGGYINQWFVKSCIK